MITEELKKLYCTYTGHEPEAIEELPSSGSNRRYFRLTGTPTLIGVSGTSLEENQAFLYMADHFRKKGLPVPQVVAKSDNDAFYLQEDLGDTLLFNAIEKGRKTSVFDEEEKQLLRKTVASRAVLRCRRNGLLILLPTIRIQQPQYLMGLELLQILFSESYRNGISGRPPGR